MGTHLGVVKLAFMWAAAYWMISGSPCACWINLRARSRVSMFTTLRATRLERASFWLSESRCLYHSQAAWDSTKEGVVWPLSSRTLFTGGQADVCQLLTGVLCTHLLCAVSFGHVSTVLKVRCSSRPAQPWKLSRYVGILQQIRPLGL